jgi:hypothetical protein
LYFFPDPQGRGSLRLTFSQVRRWTSELQAPKKTDGSKQSDLPQSALAAACWYRELKVSLTRASSSVG